MWDRGDKKFESLKDFAVRVVRKMEPWEKRIRSINLVGTVICSKKKINVETSPDQVIRVSIRSASAFSGCLVGLRYPHNNFRSIHFSAS
jgi:hypothetical protein